MEEHIQNLSISDLFRLSLPLTGAASLHSYAPTPSSQSPLPPPPSKKLKTLKNPNKILTLNPNPGSFSSITHPVLLTGTIGLHSSNPNLHAACRNHCLSFSDGSSTVCSSVLQLDPGIVGRSIEITAFNFLPLNGGFLEIVKCRSPSPSLSPPSRSPQLNAIGRLIAISPVFSVPCQNPRYGGNSVGFLAEIATCGCGLCKSYNEVKSPIWEQSRHYFERSDFVYFLKPGLKWRPVVNKLVGRLVTVSGLKKKMIFVGGDVSYRMLVTTEMSGVSLCRLLMEGLSVGKRVNDGEGVYCGIVTGVYMHGMVVELDGKVWLLITDSAVAPQHSLRVGAIISVRNFHLVHPKFSWIKMLLLGTCVRTSIELKSFSLSHSRSYVRTQSQSMLGDFIGSLTLSSKFWVLLLVSCFRRKFAKIFSDKQILGSKNQEGLAQMYASACLGSHNFISQQNGLFMDFCKHDNCTCRNESDVTPLRLVIPISNLLSKCEEIWVSLLSKTPHDAETVKRDDYGYSYTDKSTSFSRITRRIIPSKDLGFILMGSFKISSSSGRLQFADETGTVDAVVPDLLSDTNVDCIYEVQNYKLVMEGLPMHLDSVEFHSSEALTCKNIFEKFPLKKVLNQLAVYVHFYLKDSTCLNGFFRLPYTDMNDDLSKTTGEITQILLVTHKFPATWNFQDDQIISSNSCLYAEAIVLPYKLTFPEDNNYNQNEEVFLGKLHSHSDNFGHQESPTKGWPKRPKVSGMCSRIKINISENNSEEFKGSISKLPCLFTFKSSKHEGTPIPGYLCHTEGTSLGSTADNQWDKRILIEFTSDSFCKYQVLKVGGYYIVKCSNRGYPYDDAIGNGSMSCAKICITSETTLWGLSFTSAEIMCHKELSQSHPSIVSSPAFPEDYQGQMCQNDLIFTESLSQAHSHSDIHVHLSSESILSLTSTNKATESDGVIRLLPTYGEILSVSSCILAMKAEVPRHFGATDPQRSYLPQGSLISLCGTIEEIHIYNCQLGVYTSSQHSDFTNINQSTACKIVIHVYDDHHMVQICDNWNKFAYPLGMGPGANATFYRVLMTCTPSECPRLLLTSVSFIVINSVKEADRQLNRERFTPLSRLDNVDPFGKIPLRLMSQLTQHIESKLVRMHCRVVMVLHLVLQKHFHDPANYHSIRQLELPKFAIPLAGFVLDDGSSLCCCWANAGRAEMLLKLHETTRKAYFNDCRKLRTTVGKSHRLTVGYHMEKMLKKYHRVTMKNHDVTPDSSSLGFTFTVDSHEVFSYSDEKLLRCIVLNACTGSSLNVVGKMMDSDAFQMLDTLLQGLDIAMQPMQNFWITEVGYLNPLKEGRDILDELKG